MFEQVDMEEFGKEPVVSIELDGRIILHGSKELESSIELDGRVDLIGSNELDDSAELGGDGSVELGGSIELNE